MSMTRDRILDALGKGTIGIVPFQNEQLSVASYDVTLWPELLVYSTDELDTAVDNPTQKIAIGPDGYLLRPNQLYIACTVEIVSLPGAEAIVDGKSSFGRLGLSIHQTAGYLDPGFSGQVTLELSVIRPLRVYAGQRIGQVRFFTPEGPIVAYQGKYTGQLGPTPSRSWIDTKRPPRAGNAG